MGIFDFLMNAGKEVPSGNEAESIKAAVRAALDDDVDDLNVFFNDGTVMLTGTVSSFQEKQRAILVAGNIRGIEKVNATNLEVRASTMEMPRADVNTIPNVMPPSVEPEPEFEFYEIKSGDSLSKIAGRYYGDVTKWPVLFEANKGIIENADLIYPGQQIRVPKKI